jgi:ankyrin repeat protein
MAGRRPIELTEEERRAAELDAVMMEAVRRINGPDAPSLSDLFGDSVISVTALYGAASAGRLHRVKVALNDGADIDEPGPFGTALHGAAEDGRLEVVRLLVEQGANTRLLSPDGETPRAAAERNGHAEVAEFLRSVEPPDA